jgi:hypothetical protein
LECFNIDLILVSEVQSIWDYGSEELMLDHWMLAQNLDLVHLHHALAKIICTAVTFSQLAAPLMLLRTGDDSVKGTCFLTSMINLMQFMYMYSSEYFSIRGSYMLF